MLSKNKKYLSQKEKDSILYCYTNNEISATSLAKKHDTDIGVILRLLRKNAISVKSSKYFRKKYYQYDDFFSKVNTEEKSYWLGFLMADGYNSGNKISINLAITDIKHLKKFKQAISFTGKINEKDCSYQKEKYNRNSKNQASIRIHSSKMGQDLINLGCIPNKSLTLKFPCDEQVPNYLFRHFIRGYFDGDGCFCMYEKLDKRYNAKKKTKEFCIAICCSYDFGKDLQKYLKEHVSINTSYCLKDKIAVIKFGGRINCFKFLDFIYKDATVYLDRKYNKYLEFVKYHWL